MGSTWPKFTPFAQGTSGCLLFISFTSRRDYGFLAQGATQLVASHSRDPGLFPPEVIELAVGGDLPLEEIAGRLVAMGYERNYIVERRGEFAIRGGILDVFPPAHERPVRAELWGDEISSLRQFALASQRSLAEIDTVRVVPCRELRADERTRRRAAELAATQEDPDLAALAEGIVNPGAERLLPLLAEELVPLTSLLPEGAPTIVLDPKRVEDRAVDEVVAVQEAAGLPVVSDGEQRRLSFQSQLLEAVEGFGEWDVDAFLWGDWHSEEHGDHRVERPPLAVTAALRRRRRVAVEELV
jgi:transcription-repair coupling factor (superfamily II helicase)